MSLLQKETLVLSSSDIEAIATRIGMDELMDVLIERLHIAFRDFDSAQTTIPVRSGFNYQKPHSGLIEWMPLYSHGREVVMKMVGYHPDNPDNFDLPTIISTISCYDTATGHLKSIMDGVFLTALRTGAASAVASRALAAPQSTVLGLIGCGAQSVTQLHALSRVFHLTQVLYFDIDPDISDSFENRIAMLDLNLHFIPADIEKIVRHSDIICTATSIKIGEGPLFNNMPTKPNLHINAVGSDFPGKTELPLEHLRNSFVCPDFVAQAVVEGECQQLKPEEIAPDLFECIKYPERFEGVKMQCSVFDSTGLALEDQVVMDLFQEYALQMGLGQKISIEKIPEDAKNPYHFLKESEQLELKNLLKIVNK